MSISLNKRREQAGPLSFEQVDENWDIIESIVNQILLKGGISLTKNLTAGNFTVAHNLDAKARFVTFFLANGTPVNYTWYRDPADELNKIIVEVPADAPAAELLTTEINILAI